MAQVLLDLPDDLAEQVQILAQSDRLGEVLSLGLNQLEGDENVATQFSGGQAIAKAITTPQQQPSFLGYMQDSVTINGDIIEPTNESWEACE